MANFFFRGKKINFSIFFIFLLILILCKNIDFFKKIYVIINNDNNIRQQAAYDFCGNQGNGYIFYVKKKFKLKQLPIIKNVNKAPNQSWIFNDPFNRIDETKIIILNKTDKKHKYKLDFTKYKVLDNFNDKCFLLEKI